MRPLLSMLVACALLAAMLAGCSQPDRVPTRVVLAGDCGSLGERFCTMDDGTLRVRDLVVEGAPGRWAPSVALTIRPTTPVEISNVFVSGSDIGVLFDTRECPTCTITMVGASVHAVESGVAFLGDGGRVTIEASTIRTDGGGTVTYDTAEEGNVRRNITWTWGGSAGILLDRHPDLELTLRDVRIQAEPSSVLDAIGGIKAEVAKLVAQRVEVDGHRVGLSYEAASGSLRDVSIRCGQFGITVGQPTPFHATGIEVAGCSEIALEVGAPELRVDGLAIDGGKVGIRGGHDVVELRNFDIRNTGHGLEMRFDNIGQDRGTFVNGVVEDNSFAGLEARYQNVTVQNVTFRGNGGSWRDAPDRELPLEDRLLSYGGLVLRVPRYDMPSTLVVTESSFEDNVPFGLAGLSVGTVAAVGNWWGSPDGPHVYHPEGHNLFPRVSAGGRGDNVTVTTVFAPWLTSPP